MSDRQHQKPRERFFNEITPLVYDLQFCPDAPDVAFWVEWCKEIGGPVLELGCGNGRIAIPLARAGLRVVGIDLAAPMLEAARRRLAAEPPEVRALVDLLEGDMRGPLPSGPFPCVIMPARTFMVLLTREDQERMLAAVSEVLAPGGRFAFDLPAVSHGPLGAPGRLPPVRRTSADGAVDLVEERTTDIDAAPRIGTSTITYTFHRPKGLGRVTEHVRGRMADRNEVEGVLNSSGYVLDALWGDYDRSPFTPESRAMVFVARSKG